MFLDTVDDSNLIQHVKEFTRKRGTDNPSLLDLVLTDDQQVVSKPLITDPLTKQKQKQKITDMSIVTYNITYTTCHLATFTIIIYNTILSEYLNIMPGHDVLKRAVLFLGSEQSALNCLKISLYFPRKIFVLIGFYKNLCMCHHQ